MKTPISVFIRARQLRRKNKQAAVFHLRSPWWAAPVLAFDRFFETRLRGDYVRPPWLDWILSRSGRYVIFIPRKITTPAYGTTEVVKIDGEWYSVFTPLQFKAQDLRDLYQLLMADAIENCGVPHRLTRRRFDQLPHKP